ncbi:succinylglutamate desuccinylase/aspartoacylase family protein [Aliagarivorans marinus]|uniref:succinylglutamate desuccinylase/aspartoacylase family protein n=1 Tax=Aliagarivorans marinus TaxID=561965 RepID=UPI0006864FC6|nr:succinylglutamate desuccinylase/aspartoacylase family protein [Aliagarivorans marinus]
MLRRLFPACLVALSFVATADEQLELLEAELHLPELTASANALPETSQTQTHGVDDDIASASIVEGNDPAAEAEPDLPPPLEEASPIDVKPEQPEEAEGPEPWGRFRLLNTELEPNSKATLGWFSGHLSGGFDVATPVVVIHGAEPGPRVCITAAVHGDEVNGVEIARRVINQLQPETLKGTVISVPVVNIDGLWRKDRYMSDRRDLNRAFPGHPQGTTASRVAYSLFNSIIKHCDTLVDLHSGSMYRENNTQLRADLTIPEVAELAKQFGAIAVLQSLAPPGSLRGAATAAGIPAVVMEVGGPYTVDEKLVETGVKALQSYLSSVNMLPRSFFWSSPQPVFYASRWIRSKEGGILISRAGLGQRVRKGELLGTISNPISDEVEEVFAPFDAEVLGRAQNQFVSAGYAIYNLGERRSIEDLEQEAEQIKRQVAASNAEQMGLESSSNDATTATGDDTAPEADNTEQTATENEQDAAVTEPTPEPTPLPADRLPQPEDEDG